MSEGLNKLKELEAQGYGITKSRETPEGMVRCIMTQSSTGLKKVIDLTPEEYKLAMSRR
ncbi:MAG TPA: hypothetical protein GXX51_07140 [Firmicutes bacterium]|nr:hypothetical protein [Bacillota bacterium]